MLFFNASSDIFKIKEENQMGEAYIIIAVITFFSTLRKGFLVALITAVFWPVAAVLGVIMIIVTAIATRS